MATEKIEKVLANMPQGLTEPEQAQARANIGAASASEVPAQLVVLRKATDTANVYRYVKVAELVPDSAANYNKYYSLSFVISGPTGADYEQNENGRFSVDLQVRQDLNVYYITGGWSYYHHHAYNVDTTDPYRNVSKVLVLRQMENGAGGQKYCRKVEVWLQLWTGFSDHDSVTVSVVENTGASQYRSTYPSKYGYNYPWVITKGTAWATTTVPTMDSTSPMYYDTLEFDAVDTDFVQVNADWDAASGVAQILNKPTIPTVPTIDLMNYSEPVSIEGGQFVNPETYSFNKYIPVGQKFYGTLAIQMLYSTSNLLHIFELGTNSNTLTCNFGDYASSRQSGHVIPIYVDNTNGSAPVQLFFTLAGQFESQTLNCKIQGITIG